MALALQTMSIQEKTTQMHSDVRYSLEAEHEMHIGMLWGLHSPLKMPIFWDNAWSPGGSYPDDTYLTNLSCPSPPLGWRPDAVTVWKSVSEWKVIVQSEYGGAVLGLGACSRRENKIHLHAYTHLHTPTRGRLRHGGGGKNSCSAPTWGVESWWMVDESSILVQLGFGPGIITGSYYFISIMDFFNQLQSAP